MNPSSKIQRRGRGKSVNCRWFTASGSAAALTLSACLSRGHDAPPSRAEVAITATGMHAGAAVDGGASLVAGAGARGPEVLRDAGIGVRSADVPRDASADAHSADASRDARARSDTSSAAQSAGGVQTPRAAAALSVDDGGLDAGVQPRQPSSQASGRALDGVNAAWTYSAFPDAQCRDASTTGVAVNFNRPSRKLVVYLEGGGWCVDQDSCGAAGSASNASANVLLLGSLIGTTGVFDRNNRDNPLRDWNFVYVPYCTGDFHAGTNPHGDVPGVGPQKFVGRLNLLKFLDRIVPTFKDASDVLLLGASAGGFGAVFNGPLVQRAFPNAKVSVISDSGPSLSSPMWAECLQASQRTLWKLDDSILAECGSACPNPSDYGLDFAVFVAKTFSDRPLGFIESTEDGVIRDYFGTGNADCTGPLNYLAPEPSVTAAAYRAALATFRSRLEPYRNVGTFFPQGSAHTWVTAIPTVSGDFYAASADGERMVDWFAKIVRGETPGHAGL